MTDDYKEASQKYKAELREYEFPHYTNSQLVQLQQAAADGDQEAYQALWMHGVRMVEKIVKKWVNLGKLQAYQADDARQEGNLAIGEALFNWTNNRSRYSTYFWLKIRDGLSDYLHKESRQGFTGEGAEGVGVGPLDKGHLGDGRAFLETDIQGIGHDSPEKLVIDVLDLEAAIISVLTDKEEDVILKYYFEDQNIVEIGEQKKVSPQAVNQMREKALGKLRNYFDSEV